MAVEWAGEGMVVEVWERLDREAGQGGREEREGWLTAHVVDAVGEAAEEGEGGWVAQKVEAERVAAAQVVEVMEVAAEEVAAMVERRGLEEEMLGLS